MADEFNNQNNGNKSPCHEAHVSLERKDRSQIGRTVKRNKESCYPSYQGKNFANHAAGNPKKCGEQEDNNEDPVELSET